MIPNFTYVRPDRLKEAVEQLEGREVRIHAGGTDLLSCLRDGVFDAGKVVSISALKDMHGIKETANGGLRIGALTTISEIADHELIRTKYAGLAQGASEVASPQLRNQGTIGGNICQKPRCWYYRGEFHCLRKGGAKCFAVKAENQFHCILGGNQCFIVHPSDTAPALVALQAKIRLHGPQGNRSVAAEDFFVPPATDPTRETVVGDREIVTEILLPPPPANLRSSYRKIRARKSWDFALAGAALALQFEGDKVRGGRVVLSGAAPVPWRSKEVEEVIIDSTLDAKTIDKASQAVIANARPMSKNRYKLHLFSGMMEEELLAIKEKA